MKSFIQNVKIREPLWNSKHPDYHNRNKVKKLWDEVGRESEMSGEAAVKKFKNLKDTFRREFRKITLSSTTSKPKTTKWLHYKHLAFLTEIMITRLKRENPQVEIKDVEVQKDTKEEKEAVLESGQNDSDHSTEDNQPLSVSYRKVKQKRKTEDSDVINLEKKKLALIEKDIETKQEDDYHYLMSFRQYMKKMSDDKKLLFRIKMQEVLYDVLYNNETA